MRLEPFRFFSECSHTLAAVLSPLSRPREHSGRSRSRCVRLSKEIVARERQRESAGSTTFLPLSLSSSSCSATLSRARERRRHCPVARVNSVNSPSLFPMFLSHSILERRKAALSLVPGPYLAHTAIWGTLTYVSQGQRRVCLLCPSPFSLLLSRTLASPFTLGSLCLSVCVSVSLSPYQALGRRN